MCVYIHIRRMAPLLLALAILASVGGCLSTGPNTLPAASFGYVPENGFVYAPVAIKFDAHASIDPDGHISSYHWDFGDGANGNGVAPTHTYAAAGTYTVALQIVDNRGGEASLDQQIMIPPVPDGQILRRYSWTYEGNQKTLELLIPQALYNTYHNQYRPPLVGTYKYDDYVLEPRDDPTISDIAAALRAKIGGDNSDFAKFALSFVQGAISYVVDPPGFEYPLYPLETLVDKQGDCEDTTILYASLLRAQGIPVTIAFVDTDRDDLPDHVLALVLVPSSFATQVDCPNGMSVGVYPIGGQFFAIAETAADPDTSGYIPLGCDPWGISTADFKQTWKL